MATKYFTTISMEILFWYWSGHSLQHLGMHKVLRRSRCLHFLPEIELMNWIPRKWAVKQTLERTLTYLGKERWNFFFQEKVPAFQACPDGREVPSVKIAICGEESEAKTARYEQIQLWEKAAEWKQQQQRAAAEAAAAAARFDHEEAEEEEGGGEQGAPPAQQGRHAAHHREYHAALRWQLTSIFCDKIADRGQ